MVTMRLRRQAPMELWIKETDTEGSTIEQLMLFRAFSLMFITELT